MDGQVEKTKSLLIVDDASALRETLGDAMEKKGIKVLRAGTGVAAVKLYREHKPDVVFLDIKLPDVNGMNVLEQIKEMDPHAKVYFITGKDNPHFREKATSLGATGYLVKPVFLQDLLEILKKE